MESFNTRGTSGSGAWGRVMSKFIDFLIVSFGLPLVYFAYRFPDWDERYLLAGAVAGLLYIFIAELAGNYRSWSAQRYHLDLMRVLYSWGAIVFIVLLIGYVGKVSAVFSRTSVLIWFGVTPLLLIAWRIVGIRLMVGVMSGVHQRKRAVLWGGGDLADQLVAAIDASPWLGMQIVDRVGEDAAPCAAPDRAETGVRSQVEELVRRAEAGEFEVLYLILPATSRATVEHLVDRLSDTTVSVFMVPDYFTNSLFHGHWSTLEGIPVVSVFHTPFWGTDGWLKRTEDLVLASLILLLVSIPMLLVAAAVKLSSPGPVLFRQRRYGIDGKEIEVWKFRTMRVCEDGAVVTQATKGDPRVTPVGGFLRRTSLDELPQFFNVLRGEMSIVGPRPHAVAHNEEYRKKIKGYMLRHKVKPGITGWAQVNGWRGETDTLDKMARRVEHDLWYIRNWSVWLDLEIILLTALRGFTGKSAY